MSTMITDEGINGGACDPECLHRHLGDDIAYEHRGQSLPALPQDVYYTAGGVAKRLRAWRRFGSARLMDAGIRRDLQLD
jgi:hypothetical protein